jgi:hypothetical protein
MKEILQTKVLNSLIALKAGESCHYLDCLSFLVAVNNLAYHVD